MLDQLALAARLGGFGSVPARAGLDRRLLIRAHDEIAGPQQLALPAALVQIKDPAGLLSEPRVAWEDPRAVVPRRIASSLSQRQIVIAAIVATIPRLTASRASSALDQRESGTPFSAGSSHASALTSATCAGGKTPRPTRPRSFLKTSQPLLAETSSPPRDSLARLVEALGDLRV
jgi:hypothetical protein